MLTLDRSRLVESVGTKGKRKAVPLQAPAAFTPGNAPGTHFC